MCKFYPESLAIANPGSLSQEMVIWSSSMVKKSAWSDYEQFFVLDALCLKR